MTKEIKSIKGTFKDYLPVFELPKELQELDYADLETKLHKLHCLGYFLMTLPKDRNKSSSFQFHYQFDELEKRLQDKLKIDSESNKSKGE